MFSPAEEHRITAQVFPEITVANISRVPGRQRCEAHLSPALNQKSCIVDSFKLFVLTGSDKSVNNWFQIHSYTVEKALNWKPCVISIPVHSSRLGFENALIYKIS